MKKYGKWGIAGMLLAALLCFTGCSAPEVTEPPEQESREQLLQTEARETVPPYTYPPDGNPEDITCLGSYTREGGEDTVVVRLDGAELTNGQLRAWYWLTVAAYRQAGTEPQPDFSLPLDAQPCTADESVASWQQFFLRECVNSWHTAQALALQGEAEGIPTETAYQPNLTNHEKNLQDIPATRFLYGYNKSYLPNTMHQAYLEGIPALLEQLAQEAGFGSAEELAKSAAGTDLEALTEAAGLYNLAYMYLTTLSYDLTPSREEVRTLAAEQELGEVFVDFRHILMVPEGEVSEEGTVQASEESWEACRKKSEELLQVWKLIGTEASFADLANKYSQDSGSAPSGGAYRQVSREQLLPELAEWCFAADRKSGETELLRSEYGWHLIYFVSSEDSAQAAVREILTAGKQTELMEIAREKYPIEISYGDISLTEAEAVLSLDDVLYPDVAHERFPEVPLYLQQDYPTTMYGWYPVATHGCGITSMAMLASYLTDDELTVPEMCAQFGRYCLETGTNYMLFQNEPAGMGFFMRKFTRSADEAKEALKEGYIVVSLQFKGYWTRGGHFIVIEEIMEDDRVRVRDSNIFNYGSLEAHKEDLHEWSCIPPRSNAYWIYEKKVTNIQSCHRCGEPEGTAGGIVQDYCCEKCRTALLRRDNYLSGGFGE